MNYDFPHITHLDQVRDVIKDLPEFIIAERDWGYVVNYLVSMSSTFPKVTTRADAIRRECRGLIFDRNGHLISRPYQKFFNVGEKDETQADCIDLGQPHVILEKLDGSMVRPIPIDDGYRLSTKMGITDVAMQAEMFVAEHPNYDEFIRLHIERGQTPIFEWCSKKQQIVISYPNDRLVLTAIRDINSGEYKSYQQMVSYANAYDVEVVQAYAGTVTNMENLVAETRGLQGQEGWVIRFDTGHMIKIKSSIYVNIHQAKDNILREKNVIEMLISETVDDVKPFLLADDLKRLEDYETAFWQGIAKCAEVWKHQFLMVKMEHGNDRKGFALDTRYQDLDHNLKSAIFCYWDMVADANWRQAVIDVVAKNLGTQPRVDSVRELFGNAKWNYGAVIDGNNG